MKITVGRSRTCDVILNNENISREHAIIKIVNGGYVYEDISTNGSVVNGAHVKSQSVNVKPGDSIMLAGKEALPWDKVTMLLPLNMGYNMPPQPQAYSAPAAAPAPVSAPAPAAARAPQPSRTPSMIDSWNWGGFVFGWIWAAFNGLYWPFLIFLIPGFGFLASIVVAVILGLKGHRMAWEKSSWAWRSVEQFETAQKHWKIAGIIGFILLAFGGFIMIFASAVIGSIFSGLF